jgi:hypothetical protein
MKTKEEFLFLQNLYPFIINGKVYGLSIHKKTANKQTYEELKKFLLIRNVRNIVNDKG